MVERQDIDALLISALYGELTPAEESRLAAHLDSHPADRSALDGLTRAREVIHTSRILAVQFEPPQAVSALLMQEASRRAPKKPVEGEGWFARFVRSFVQHPAMAAAAMLVVVVGAATIVSRTSGDHFAETPAVETAQRAEPASDTIALNRPEEPAAPAATPAAAPGAAPDTAGQGQAGTDQFKVALADERLDTGLDRDAKEGAARAGAKADLAKNKGEAQALPETDPNVGFYDGAKSGKAVAKPTPAATGGIEVRQRESMPKDFEDEVTTETKPTERAKNEKIATSTDDNWARPADAGERTRDMPGDGVGRARGGGGAAAAPQAPPAPVTKAPEPKTAPRTVAPPPPPAPAKIATDATSAETQKKDKDKVVNDPNAAWARDQHAALVTAVRANNCGRAANIALAIENRAPAYYAQNVASDRSVKECLAYINRERDKEQELRAQRAKKATLKNAEPAPKRAADEASKATATEQSK